MEIVVKSTSESTGMELILYTDHKSDWLGRPKLYPLKRDPNSSTPEKSLPLDEEELEYLHEVFHKALKEAISHPDE